MRNNNLHDSDFEKRKEEMIAGLMSKLVIMPFGPFKMSFISPKTEAEKVNNEKKKVDEADELKIVRETKSVEEVQEKYPPRKAPQQRKII